MVTQTVKKHHDQREVDEKGFILFTFTYKSPSSEAVRAGIHQIGQEAGSRSRLRGHRDMLLIALSMWLAHAALLCNPRPLAHSGTNHMG